ncbi:efflux RND transporter periplasmic adaptor subunit [Eubacterium xylanophilum]|uniref:efflux RND transporter periplasmic adaptor subunit n=1 Tax=Eubacterium xylanophilum TaxID=39497 RepID=UPI0004786DCF|nr:biotin/lipoyl-binding protein [Eubacterium xylanophilum]
MRRKSCKTIGALLVATMVLSSTGCALFPTEEEFSAPPIVKEFESEGYSKVTVTRGNLQKVEDINAKYKGTVREELMPDGSGIIEKVCVKKGQKVEAGDVIFHYLIQSGENSLEESTNKIEDLTLQIKHAKRLMELEVAKLKRTGGSSEDIANVKNQYTQEIKYCESSLKLAKLDKKIAKEEIEEGDVTASVDGTIKKIDTAMIGGYGDPEKPLVVIEGKKKNRFEANSKFAKYCKEGQVVSIDVKGHEHKAVIKKDKSAPNSVYFYPKTKIKIEDDTLGTYKVVLKERKNVLYLPNSIVYAMGDKNVVYYEDENGLKSTKEVKVGETIQNFVEILSGVEENEQVIAN